MRNEVKGSAWNLEGKKKKSILQIDLVCRWEAGERQLENSFASKTLDGFGFLASCPPETHKVKNALKRVSGYKGGHVGVPK